jgi:hypothetical protein
MYPLKKKFKKFKLKNAIKLDNRGHPFFTTPCTPSKEFENDCDGHPWDPKIVAVVDWWSLFRGSMYYII